MNEKEMQAYKRLAKKLTALRKTLRKDERDILDRLVAKQDSEVEGHMTLESAENVLFTLSNGLYTAESTVL